MINKVILVGHLGRDPEIRRTQDGKPVASFSLATSERWKDKTTGERREHTDWHQVVIFNEGLAAVAEKYLKKGSKVYVEGAQKTRKWTAKDGVDKYVTETVLSGFNCRLVLMDRAERAPAASEDSYGDGDTRDSSGVANGASATRDAPPPATPPAGRRDDMDDEIPF